LDEQYEHQCDKLFHRQKFAYKENENSSHCQDYDGHESVELGDIHVNSFRANIFYEISDTVSALIASPCNRLSLSPGAIRICRSAAGKRRETSALTAAKFVSCTLPGIPEQKSA
jgi:hypothetical protein